MTERSITHSTFTLEREYAAPVATVWEALTVQAVKAKWFGDVDNQPANWTIDFREGGRARALGTRHTPATHRARRLLRRQRRRFAARAWLCRAS